MFEARKRKVKRICKAPRELFGLKHMSFNLHHLLHAYGCVADWGPLWAYSLYYEGENGGILKMFNETQIIPIQISNRVQQFQTLEALKTTLNSLNNPEMEFFLRIQNKLLGSYVQTKKII